MANAINMFKNQTNPSANKTGSQDLNLSDEETEETPLNIENKKKLTKKTKSKIVIQKKVPTKKKTSSNEEKDFVLIESESEEEISKPTTSRTLRKRKSNDTLCKRLSSPESELDEGKNESSIKLKKN